MKFGVCLRAGESLFDLLAGIVHPPFTGVYRPSMENFAGRNRFHYEGRQEGEGLVGGDSFTVLIEVVANFFHDLLVFGVITQIVVVLVALEPWIVVVAESDRAPQPG